MFQNTTISIGFLITLIFRDWCYCLFTTIFLWTFMILIVSKGHHDIWLQHHSMTDHKRQVWEGGSLYAFYFRQSFTVSLKFSSIFIPWFYFLANLMAFSGPQKWKFAGISSPYSLPRLTRFPVQKISKAQWSRNSKFHALQTLANQWHPNFHINMIFSNILSLGSFFSQHPSLDTFMGQLHYTLTS